MRKQGVYLGFMHLENVYGKVNREALVGIEDV